MRIVVAEGRGHDARRIVQRPPDVLAAAVPHRQAVGIVHFRAPVDGGGLDRLGEPVHRGHRRQAEAVDIAAQEQRGLHFHAHRLAASHVEAIGAGDAGTLEQGADRHRVAAIGRSVEEELGEDREFLGLARHRHVERGAARRQAVLVQLADGAEVGGAEEGDPVVLAPVEAVLVVEAAFLEAEAGEARALGQLARRAVGRHVEVVGIVDHFLRLTLVDHVHAHRRLEVAAEVEEGHRVLAGAVGEQGQIGLEVDLAVGVVVDTLQHLARQRHRRGVGLGGERAGLLDQAFIGEGGGAAELEPLGGRGGRRDAEHREGEGSAARGEEVSAIDHGLSVVL